MSDKVSYGIGFGLFALLCALKLSGVITLSWWWILPPPAYFLATMGCIWLVMVFFELRLNRK